MIRGFDKSLFAVDRRFAGDVRAYIQDNIESDIESAQVSARAIYADDWRELPRPIKLALVLMAFYMGNGILGDLGQLKAMVTAGEYEAAADTVGKTDWAHVWPDRARTIISLMLAGVAR